MSVSLKQIRYFVAAAETGRINQAAFNLNVSQSAVTAAIQQLEAMLGARLLERSASGVAVTLEGGRFLAQGRQILAAVAEAMQVGGVAAPPLVGEIRVGVTYTVAGYFLPRHHARFCASFPKVEVALWEAPRDVLERALIDGALDLAVMLVSNLSERKRLSCETLLRSPRRLWLAPQHPLLAAARVTLADVRAHPYVMLTVDEAKHTSMKYWRAAGLSPRTMFSTSSVEAVRSMVAGGAGVSILSDLVYRPWSLEGQRIETRILEDEVPTMDVGLAWKAGAALSSAAAAFADFLRFAVAGVGAARARVADGEG